MNKNNHCGGLIGDMDARPFLYKRHEVHTCMYRPDGKDYYVISARCKTPSGKWLEISKDCGGSCCSRHVKEAIFTFIDSL